MHARRLAPDGNGALARCPSENDRGPTGRPDHARAVAALRGERPTLRLCGPHAARMSRMSASRCRRHAHPANLELAHLFRGSQAPVRVQREQLGATTASRTRGTHPLVRRLSTFSTLTRYVTPAARDHIALGRRRVQDIALHGHSADISPAVRAR